MVSLGFRYTEVNSGQVVDLFVPPFYLDGLARWVREDLDDVAVAEAAVEVAVDAVVVASSESVAAGDGLAAAHEGAAEVLQSLEGGLVGEVFPSDDAAPETAAEPVPAVSEADAKPEGTTAADRDEWVTYALAHGKTTVDVKGVKVKTIASWFD